MGCRKLVSSTRWARILVLACVLGLALVSGGCAVQRQGSIPEPPREGDSGSEIRLEALELLGVLQTEGASADGETVQINPPSADTSATIAYINFDVPAMGDLDERDAYIVLASVIAQTSCTEAQVHAQAMRSDGTIDLRSYLWAGNRLEIITSRRSGPGAVAHGKTIATIDDMDAARIRAIALGDEDVPSTAD